MYLPFRSRVTTLGCALALSLGLAACAELGALLDESVVSEDVGTANSSPVSLAAEDKQEASRSVMAVYLMGSDLEDGRGDPLRGGAGTSDLSEMVRGFQSLNAEQQKNIDVIVGFGGANKIGWKGIRYADMPCLIEDSQDNVFGNASCYSKVDTQANMGAHETLTDFLSVVNARLQPKDKSTFIFWDHGASYLGIGPDTNYPQDGVLTMEDLNISLSSTSSQFNTIGFDACLMGSVEVAKTVVPFANYMVASEELEPGHGWDYEDLVSFSGANPEATPLAIGKKYVSSFISSPKHKGPGSNIKTLSLVDLQKYAPVEQALSALAEAMGQNLDKYYQAFLQAAGRSEGYGVQNKGGVEMGVDLKHLAENIKRAQPELGSYTDTLVQALSQYVVATEKDKSRPNASGAAIFSPRYSAPIQNGSYSDQAAASKSWKGLSQKFVDKGLNDDLAPVISVEADCLEDTECLSITDNVGVSEVLSLNAVLDPQNPDNVIITSTVNMDLTRKEGSDTYALFPWDGTAEALCNGPCNKDDFSNVLGIPANVENFTEEGNLLASADGLLNGSEVVYYFIADESGVIDFWAVPFIEDEQGNIFMNKEQLSIKQGDEVQFINLEVDIKTDEESYVVSNVLKITQEPTFESLKLPGQRFYFALASDLKGNIAVSEPRVVVD